MVEVVVFASLIAYSVVASQPLAYLVFLARAQRALSAAAYIELRQRINAVMNRRIPVIYGIALASVLAQLVLALRERSGIASISAGIALLALGVDLVLMRREAVPINGVVDRWSPAEPPPDWEDYRTRWLAVFAYRQVVLLAGLIALLAGAVCA